MARRIPALGVYRIRRTWLRRAVLAITCVPQTVFWFAWVLAFALWAIFGAWIVIPIVHTAMALTNTARGLWALAWSSPMALVAAWHGQTLAQRYPEHAEYEPVDRRRRDRRRTDVL